MNANSSFHKSGKSCDISKEKIKEITDDIITDTKKNNKDIRKTINTKEKKLIKSNKKCPCYDCCNCCTCCYNNECTIKDDDCSNIIPFANLLTLPSNFCPCSSIGWENLKISIQPCLHCILEPCAINDAHLVFTDPCGERHDLENHIANLKRVRIVGCIQYILSAQSTITQNGITIVGASVSDFYTICVDRVVGFISDCFVKTCSISVDYQNLIFDNPPEIIYGNSHALKIKGEFVLKVSYIKNGSFENGFNDWSLTVPSGASADTVNHFNNYCPIEGCYFALLKTNGPGSYTTLSQTFTANAGDTIEGYSFFKTNDYMPFNDNCKIVIKSGNASGPIIATPFSESVATVGDYGQTPWKHWSYTFTNNGEFTVEAKIANAIDSILDSYIGIDAIHLISL